MIYLDANLFGYAFLYEDTRAEKATQLLEDVTRGKEAAATSALTYDEVVWSTRKFRGTEKSYEIGRAFLSIRNLELLPVDRIIISLSHELTKKHDMKPRDAIHAASCIYHKIPNMYSEDAIFDRIPEIKRKWVTP